MYVFNIAPMPTPRPRVSRYGVYYPKKYASYKKDLELLSKATVKKHFKGAIKLKCTFYIQIPKSLSKVKQKALDGQYHIKLGDCDNYVKGLKDCLSDIAYDDDCQVAVLEVSKLWDFNPRIEFELFEI